MQHLKKITINARNSMMSILSKIEMVTRSVTVLYEAILESEAEEKLSSADLFILNYLTRLCVFVSGFIGPQPERSCTLLTAAFEPQHETWSVSSCNRDGVANKAQNFYTQVLYIKRFAHLLD